jgi:hypothetical protein
VSSNNPSQTQTKFVSSTASGLEEGTVVGIQAFTLPSEISSDQTQNSQGISNANFLSNDNQDVQSSMTSSQSTAPNDSLDNSRLDSSYKGSPRKDLNSDFLDDARKADDPQVNSMIGQMLNGK